MGLFKKLVHFMTGRSAVVSIDVQNPTLSKPFDFTISATPRQDDLHCRNVYLLVRCKEEKLEEYKPLDEKNMTDNEKILQEMKEWDSKVVYSDKITVSDDCVMNKDKKYTFNSTLDLTQAELPTRKEDNYRVTWEVQAGIDLSGNDPDSGWVEINVNP